MLIPPAELSSVILDAIKRHREQEEADVKRMLGQWVSGCEPALAYGPRHVNTFGFQMESIFSQLIGLTIAGMPTGSPAFIVIHR